MLDLKQQASQDAEHSRDVAQLCIRIGSFMKRFTEHEMEMLKWGAYLHDCGKKYLDDALLNAPRKLTPRERIQMQTHVVLGRDFVAAMECDPIIIEIVHWHHFNEDGSGYPHSKAEPSIFPRIVRVADTYQALTSERVYRFPSSSEEAMAILEAEAGRIFNAEVVLFLRLALANEAQKEEKNDANK